MDRELHGGGAIRGASAHACRLPILREVIVSFSKCERDPPIAE